MKDLYDKNRSSISFIVTGSARLDYYRKGGDSLQGRYHYYRLHPFTAAEHDKEPNQGLVEQLLCFGGFPEPFLRGEARFHRRWLREHSARVLYEDLRGLENVREVSALELLLSHLPACVGSPLSVNSLSQLLQVSHESVERWLAIFERLYLCYRIAPFGTGRIRAVRKEKTVLLGLVPKILMSISESTRKYPRRSDRGEGVGKGAGYASRRDTSRCSPSDSNSISTPMTAPMPNWPSSKARWKSRVERTSLP